MRIYVVASDVPSDRADRPGASAVNVVVWEIVRVLRELGHEVALQLLFNVHRSQDRLTESEEGAVRDLRANGVLVPPPISPAQYRPPGARPLARARRLLGVLARRPVVSAVYPATRLRGELRDRVRASRSDLVLSVWSPEGIAACRRIGVPLASYQGDIDFEPGLWRYRDRALFGGGEDRRPLVRWSRRLRDRIWLEEHRLAHLRLMRDVSLIANVTASNADFYRRQGHPRSTYARNMWNGPARIRELETGKATTPIRIVGHAGRLDATGSVYGLRYLLVDLLPELERELAGIDHEIHIIGGGRLPDALRRHAERPGVVMRGFVDDLDAELRDTPAYLLLNNSGPYRAAFTRHLVAWSLGAFLIAHENSRSAIPEIEHERNALLGRTPREIAAAVRRAIDDPRLSLRIRRGGRETYERWFTPERVVGDLAREMQAISS